YWVTGEFQLQPIANGVSLLRPKFSSALLLLMGGGALLLLIVCANVGGLLLARTAARRGEIAIRLAVGATGKHLVRQWLTEILLLTSTGGLVGVCTAWVATPFLVRVLPPLRDLDATLLTLSLDLKPDTRLLAFSFLLCVACALLAGLPAAVQATRQDLHTALKATVPLRVSRCVGSWLHSRWHCARSCFPRLAFSFPPSTSSRHWIRASTATMW
ncbi:MAG: hypothetical protein DMG58_24480, partial [Acidobacteria bacterium]